MPTLAPEHTGVKVPEPDKPEAPKPNLFKSALERAKQPLSQTTQNLIDRLQQTLSRGSTTPGEQMSTLASEKPKDPTVSETPELDALNQTVELQVETKNPTVITEEVSEPLPRVSSEVAKLRADLGLPEVSPLLDPATLAKERREVVNQFIAEREKEIFAKETSKGFIDRRKKYVDHASQGLKNAKERQSGNTDRISRAISTNILRTFGIRNAEEIVRQVEERTPWVDYADIRNPTFMRGAKEIDDVGLAIDRMYELGFSFSSQQFQSADFMRALKVLSSIPEDDFARIPIGLNKYFFIGNMDRGVVDYNTRLLTPGFKTIVEIVGNGGLTPEQKKLLDTEYTLTVLKNVVPIKSKDWIDYKSASYDISFEQALNPGITMAEMEDMAFLAEDAVYRLFRHKDSAPYESSHLLDVATKPEGKTVIELIKSGWRYLPLEIGGNQQEYIDRLNKATELQKDPEKLAWIATVREAVVYGQGLDPFKVPQPVLDTQETSNYELMYKERNKVSALAILAQRANANLSTFIGGYADFGAKVRVDIDPINKALQSISLDEAPQQERTAWEYIQRKFAVAKYENVDYVCYLIGHRDSFNELFDVSYDATFTPYIRPTAKFMEEVLEGRVPVSGIELDGLINNFTDFENLSPQIAVANMGRFEGNQVVKLLKNLPDDFIERLPKEDQDMFRYLKANAHVIPYKFILDHKDKFPDYVRNGVLQPQFLNDYFVESDGFVIADVLLAEEVLETFPEQEKVFWRYLRDKNQYDIKRFLLTKPHDFYIQNGSVSDKDVGWDFIREIKAQPENCRTYESLTSLFRDLHVNYPKGDEAGLMYLRIAEAHRLRTIGESTEVEAVDALKRAFSELYNPTMTPFEKMSWKILEQQLPFTANVGVIENMRNKALEVETLDRNRLSWVHESVHNYASIFEVEYLQALKDYMATGDQTELMRLRDNFSGVSQSPIYTEEDRKALLGNPDVSSRLDELIELTSLFYDIRPETLREVGINNVPEAFSRNDAYIDLLTSFVNDDLPIMAEHEAVDDVVGIKRVAHFALNVNSARRMIYKTLDRPDISVEERTYGLVTDAVLDSISQTIFTRYKDYVQARGNELTQAEVLEASSVLGEVCESAYLNGEIPQEEYERMRLLQDFRHPEQISKQVLHIARLALPLVKHGVDTHWQRFTDLAKPEMVDMLMRTGLSPKEAEERAYFTDLVEFKKSSMTFVMEPLIDVMSEHLARMEPTYGVSAHSPEEEYQMVLDGKVTEGSTDNPEVAAFMQGLSSKVMPDDLEGARKFLDTLSQGSEAQAERLSRISITDYMDLEKLQTHYAKIERNGKVLEFYPVEFYGVDMVVILQDGKRVENPKEFMMENFSVPQVVINSLREGD